MRPAQRRFPRCPFQGFGLPLRFLAWVAFDSIGLQPAAIGLRTWDVRGTEDPAPEGDPR